MSVAANNIPLDSPHGARAKTLLLGGLALAMLGVLGALAYPGLREIVPAQAKRSTMTGTAIAEILLAKGTVAMRRSDQTSWSSAGQGMQLCEGDMVQTGGSGSITIRYSDATAVSLPPHTVFCIHHGEPFPMAETKPSPSAQHQQAESRVTAEQPPVVPRAPGLEGQPILELERVVAFGRTLELTGRVDPGSLLYINEESVDISGSGSFKHFTKPFPPGRTYVQLTLRVVDPRGRVRTLNATHNFGPDPGEE